MWSISAKFSTPPSGKTMDGSQKSFNLKWWHGPSLSPCKIWLKSRYARRRKRMKCDVFHFFLFVTLHGRRLLWCVVDLLPEDIASIFVRRFRCRLHLFLRKKSTFQPIEQFWKFLLGGATIGARMAQTKLKILENGWKDCAHHFDHLEARRNKISTTAFYPMYCRCALVQKYFASALQDGTIKLSTCRGSAKIAR